MGQTGSSLLGSPPSSSPTISLKTDSENLEIKTIQESEPPIINPLNAGEREKYYYFGRNNSHRKKFHYCGDCPYRACHWKSLTNHTRKIHPSSTYTALPLSRRKALKKAKGKSGQLNNNSTTIKTLNGRYRIAKLSSSLRDYRTGTPHRMKRRKVVLHQKKSDHECSLRSHSAKRKRDDYSPIKKLNNSSTSQSPSVPSVNVKKSTQIHKCAECEYETKLKGPFERHRVFHDKKFAHQCPWCSFSARSATRLTIHMKLYHTKIDKKALTSEKQENSAPKKDTIEWYYFRGGRTSYKKCGDCDYKTTKNLALKKHIKREHSFSSTANESLITKKKNYHFHCVHCPFKAKQRSMLEQHYACHRNPSAKHQCHICSYSVNHRGILYAHLKLHYLHMKENNSNNSNIGDQLNIEKGRDNKSAAGSLWNSQRYFLSCRDCRLFKTSSRFTLKRHIKKAHPFSLSALPPLSNKRIKSGLKVVQETHQPVEDALVSAPEGTQEEWYVAPNGKKRLRYIYCGDCNYRTTSRYSIIAHAEKKHPASIITVIPSQPLRTHHQDQEEPSEKEVEVENEEETPKILNHFSTLLFGQKNHLHKCSECDFSTKNVCNMKRHRKAHQASGKFKCSYCSFSANIRTPVILHLKYGHHRNLKLSETFIQEVSLETRLKKQFGIEESQVILHNILLPLIKALSLDLNDCCQFG